MVTTQMKVVARTHGRVFRRKFSCRGLAAASLCFCIALTRISLQHIVGRQCIPQVAVSCFMPVPPTAVKRQARCRRRCQSGQREFGAMIFPSSAVAAAVLAMHGSFPVEAQDMLGLEPAPRAAIDMLLSDQTPQLTTDKEIGTVAFPSIEVEEPPWLTPQTALQDAIGLAVAIALFQDFTTERKDKDMEKKRQEFFGVDMPAKPPPSPETPAARVAVPLDPEPRYATPAASTHSFQTESTALEVPKVQDVTLSLELDSDDEDEVVAEALPVGIPTVVAEMSANVLASLDTEILGSNTASTESVAFDTSSTERLASQVGFRARLRRVLAKLKFWRSDATATV